MRPARVGARMPSATPIESVLFASVHVTDLARARPFYESVLGCVPRKEMEDEVVYDMHGVGLSVHVDPDGTCGRLPGGPTGLYLRVRDAERARRDLEAAGAKIAFSNAYSVEVEDPDGNLFVLYAPKG